ncbi:phage head completion protein [Priestia megaterium]|uniref:phage head completion protein n=1 Tax=Priestia megaterium TaxID=1404 RepID=UPI000BFD2AFB|nr:head-tail adaptor protein [Priestia megaterium]PGR01346.1 phage head-tail adapter protein [Priestia megaterium]
MQPFKYTPPRVRSSDLRTWLTFYKLEKKKSTTPTSEKEQITLYECWAKIDQVWSKDFEIAKANGTLSDLTITIRDTHGEFIPTNKQHISINAPEYKNTVFNIKQVMPDLQTRGFIKIIAEVVG